MPVISPERLERDLRSLGRRELDPYALRVAAMERIERAVPLDGWCFPTADPETLVTTTHATRDIDRALSPGIYRAEYRGQDFGRHEQLARQRSPVTVMSVATDGDVLQSQRFRDVLAPMGVIDELRGAAKDGEATWGFVHLFRRDGKRPFSADEADVVARVSRTLGALLRDAMLGPAAHIVPAGEMPSFLLLDTVGRPLDGTPNARAWIEALREREHEHAPIPDVLLTLAIKADLAPDGAGARARVRGDDGRWYVLHAQRTERDAIVVLGQPATADDLLPLRLAGLGLTPGEKRVTERVLSGRSTKEIAADLVISPHTVQDRLKAIFDKAGVRSRRDLVARLTGMSAT